MLQKFTAAVLAAALMLSCAACGKTDTQPNQEGESASAFDGIRIQVLTVEYQEEETVVHVQWKNDSEYSILYGEGFGLQRWEQDHWVDCPMKENTAFISIGYKLEAGKKLTKPYALNWAFGELPQGHYRFLTSCSVMLEGNNEDCKLSAEFDLGGSDENIKGAFSKPPKLMIGSVGEAITGTYQWSCAMGDGTWSHICADSAHPLQMEKHLKVLSPGNAWVDLNFDAWPDDYSVRCWPDTAFGDTNAKSEAVMTWNNTIQLKTGGYIYEVTATWNDNGTGYYGTVTYVFYAAPAILHDVMPISTGMKLYLAGEVLGLDADRAKTVQKILNALAFDADGICNCQPEYLLTLSDGNSYGIDLSEGYVRSEKGQAKLTAQQMKDLSVIIDWALEQTKAK